MRLSVKSKLAVTAMIDVALREDMGPVSLSAICQRHEMSLSHLEGLFSKLRQHGLVNSSRGPGGGYSLSRQAEKITAADIVQAIDGELAKETEAKDGWVNSELWINLKQKMLGHLQSINLRQLANEQRAKGLPVDPKPAPKLKRGVFEKPIDVMKTTAPNSVFALAGSLGLVGAKASR